MSIVYFKKIDSYSNTKTISDSAKEIFDKLNPDFKGEVPLKIHFGEKGCETYIEQKNFLGIIDSLKQKKCKPFFTDTNVLYKGERTTRKSHIALAKQHGFTMLPIKIADGNQGEEETKIIINKKWFKKCSIGKIIADSNQMVVVAHFKGHIMAGFGGAIKQLGMGCASRQGKLAMHSHSKPIINPLACKKCLICTQHCPVDACIISKIPHIDGSKCIGCATCIAVCPHNAVKVNWISTGKKEFVEKIAEYAFAAQKNKQVVYINFVLNITKGCDCHDYKQKPIYKDFGIFGSVDPVALDKACFDLLSLRENKKVFKGEQIFDYAEQIGLGSKEYKLVEL